jgi:glycosyltransferase involved in cell wall biosynthesis
MLDELKTECKGPDRVLWMTDTFGDRNGVSTVLNAIHREICLRDLPVDLLVCSNTVQTADHLIVLKPVSEFAFPLYRQQPVRIPNFLSVQRIFRRGKYTRIICSTEGPMGMAARWLKTMFDVRISFYLHTDWLTFAKDVLKMEQAGLNRLQKVLRAYYKGFDNIFVLNTDQERWLGSSAMRIDPSRVFLTAHWADEVFARKEDQAGNANNVRRNWPTVLYAGRLSKEKGVLELPAIMSMIRSVLPEVQLVVAGTGPAEAQLKQAMPEAVFTGWVEHESLPDIYRAADILLLPSRFDTFSCVVLEALACGLPVVAYNSKGPKDILEDRVNGFLVETSEEMAGRVIEFFLDQEGHVAMKQAALARSEDYKAARIMDRLLKDIGLVQQNCPA